MSDDDAPHESRLGGILVALLIVGSAAGVLGWYTLTNRKGPALDFSGLDLNSVAPEKRAPIASANGASYQPASGIMIKSDPGLRVVDGNASSPAASRNSAPAASDPKADFRDVARRNESTVRDFAVRMTRKYPSVRQYGKDWMSYPDLRKLNDDYMRDHDPAAFMAGLARSKNFGVLVRKYATDPGIRAFVIDGVQQAPGELLGAAGDALKSDAVVKNLVTNVGNALGLPPSIMAVVGGGQVDQSKVVSDVLNNPQLKGAMQGQAPPVSLPNQP